MFTIIFHLHKFSLLKQLLFLLLKGTKLLFDLFDLFGRHPSEIEILAQPLSCLLLVPFPLLILFNLNLQGKPRSLSSFGLNLNSIHLLPRLLDGHTGEALQRCGTSQLYFDSSQARARQIGTAGHGHV